MFMWADVLNFHRTTHVSLIQNESQQKSPEQNDSDINKVLRKQKIMVNTRDNINT